MTETGPFETFDLDTTPIRGYPELRWAGKRPFTSTQFFPAQRKEQYGETINGWKNRIFWGDNLQVMSHLLREFRGQVDLIYIDPPFDSKANYIKKIRRRGLSPTGDRSGFEEAQYSDLWNADNYLQWLYERIMLCKEFLREGGSILVHCDWHKSHHIRCLLDEIFGPTGFVNEIVWHYYNKFQGNIGKFANNHDMILWYSNTKSFTHNKVREKREKPTPQIKRVWDKEKQAVVNAKGDDGKVIYEISTHRTVDDVWRLSMLQPADNVEPTGYPTQKPEHLLARIVTACSNPGDLIFDPFMGSGTTQDVALKLGRRFLGADINLGAIETTISRLLETVKELGDENAGRQLFEVLETEAPNTFYTGFDFYNVNDYDIFRNPDEAKALIAEAMELQPLSSTAVFDGQKDEYLVKIMPVNRISTRADLNDVVAGLDFKSFERRQAEAPSKVVEKIMLVCMGHEPDIGPELVRAAKPFDIEVEVVDLVRDKQNLHFKRQSDARLAIEDGHLLVTGFYPLNLLQKLSLETDAVEDWRQLVETIKVDWNYDGAILSPTIIDAPDKDELVQGRYPIPEAASTIRVKITDLLSESWEGEIEHA